MIKVSVNDDWCCASGACALTCPEVFGQGDNGMVVLLNDAPPRELESKVREAAAVCPSAVISIDTTVQATDVPQT